MELVHDNSSSTSDRPSAIVDMVSDSDESCSKRLCIVAIDRVPPTSTTTSVATECHDRFITEFCLICATHYITKSYGGRNRHVATLGGGGGAVAPQMDALPPPNVPLAIFSTH